MGYVKVIRASTLLSSSNKSPICDLNIVGVKKIVSGLSDFRVAGLFLCSYLGGTSNCDCLLKN